MTEQPTIETLQAELVALKEEHEKMIAQMDAQKQEAAKQAEDLKRARDLNAQLMAKSTVAEKSEEPDPYEGMTAEQALEAGRVPYARELLSRLAGKSSPLYGPELRRKAAVLRCRCGDHEDIPEDGALLQKARAALAAKQPEDALRYLAAMDHHSKHWHHLMGEAHFARGDYADARDHYHRCESAFDVRERLEICYRELEDYKMAYLYAKK